jgi:hypothetical protein
MTDCSRGFPEGFDAFCSLSDPRNGGATRHHFGGILFMAFAALLCGVRTYKMIEEFAEINEE